MLEHVKCAIGWMVLAGAATPALAQTIPDCERAPGQLSVDLRSDISQKVTSGSVVSLEVRSNRNDRKINRIVILADNGSKIEIGPQQVTNIVASSDANEGNTDRRLTIHTIVQINGRDPFNLNLSDDQPSDIVVFAYDNGVAVDQYCGYKRFKLYTGKLGPFAVIAGFNYPRQSFQLQYARDDAVDVAKHLINRLGLKPENVYLYTDVPLPDGTLPSGVTLINPAAPTEITDRLSEIYEDADTSALVFFYFSGHQYFFNNNRYIVLGQSDLSNGHSMLAREDLFKTIAKPGVNVGNSIRTISIFDACFSGSIVRAFNGSPQASRKGAKILGLPAAGDAGNLPALNGNARIYSSHANELSWEFSDDVKHGLFTSFLLKSASEHANDLSLDEAFKYARKQTVAYVPTDKDIAKMFRERPQQPLAEGDSDIMDRLWAVAGRAP